MICFHSGLLVVLVTGMSTGTSPILVDGRWTPADAQRDNDSSSSRESHRSKASTAVIRKNTRRMASADLGPILVGTTHIRVTSQLERIGESGEIPVATDDREAGDRQGHQASQQSLPLGYDIITLLAPDSWLAPIMLGSQSLPSTIHADVCVPKIPQTKALHPVPGSYEYHDWRQDAGEATSTQTAASQEPAVITSAPSEGWPSPTSYFSPHSDWRSDESDTQAEGCMMRSTESLESTVCGGSSRQSNAGEATSTQTAASWEQAVIMSAPSGDWPSPTSYFSPHSHSRSDMSSSLTDDGLPVDPFLDMAGRYVYDYSLHDASQPLLSEIASPAYDAADSHQVGMYDSMHFEASFGPLHPQYSYMEYHCEGQRVIGTASLPDSSTAQLLSGTGFQVAEQYRLATSPPVASSILADMSGSSLSHAWCLHSVLGRLRLLETRVLCHMQLPLTMHTRRAFTQFKARGEDRHILETTAPPSSLKFRSVIVLKG
jgi:hypothetical protein